MRGSKVTIVSLEAVWGCAPSLDMFFVGGGGGGGNFLIQVYLRKRFSEWI